MTLKDVYDTFPSGCTEDYKILRAFEMGKQTSDKKVRDLEAQIEKMNELINRYYEVCVQIPKEYRTMVFDSCLEDTRQLRR